MIGIHKCLKKYYDINSRFWKGELVDQDSNKKTFNQLKRGSSSLSNKFILDNFITWILKMPNEKEFDNH